MAAVPQSPSPMNDTSNLAIVFADLGESTRLYDTLGNVRAREITGAYIRRIAEIFQEHGGTVVKLIGDEVLARFPRAESALNATQTILRNNQTGEMTEGVRLGVHVGLHWGPVLVEPDDVFGDTVNVAARLRSLAKAGQILTSAQTVEQLPVARRAETRLVDRRSVAGRRDRLEIFEAIWQTAHLTAIDLRTVDTGPNRMVASLVLHIGPEEIRLDGQRDAIGFGRDPENELVFDDPRVSRFHARVERRHGKFVLSDRSTNGTSVVPEGQRPVFLRREELILPEAGTILIAPGTAGKPHEIRFRVATGG